MFFFNNIRYYTALITHQRLQLNYKEMKHSYISNTYWHTDTLIIDEFRSKIRCYWEIVKEDYLFSSGSYDIQSYKIIRNEK